MNEVRNDLLTEFEDRQRERQEWYSGGFRYDDNAGVVSSYDVEVDSYRDSEGTLDFLAEQSARDEDFKHIKAFGNGVRGIGRGVLGMLQGFVEGNIARQQKLDPNYKPQKVYMPFLGDVSAEDTADLFRAGTESELLKPTPVKGDNDVEQFTLDLAEGAGQLAGQVVINKVLPGLGSVTMGAQTAGNTYLRQRAEGVDRERAMNAALGNAATQTVLEGVGFNALSRVTGGPKWVNRAIDASNAFLKEGVTEGLQEIPEQFADIYAKNEGITLGGMLDKWGENAGANLKDAAYSGVIGGILGGGANTLYQAVDVYANKQTAQAKREYITKNAENILKQGVNPDYAAAVINGNLEYQETVSIPGQELQSFLQQAGNNDVLSSLGVSEATLDRAVQDGLDVSVSMGQYIATAAKFSDFKTSMENHISFNDGEYSVNYFQLQSDMQKAYEKAADIDEEANKELDAIIDSALQAGVPKQQAEGMRIMLSNFAYNLNPENPAQFLRDNGLRFVGEVTGADNGGKKWYNQITNATINLDDQMAVQPVQNVLETDNWRDAVKNYPKDVAENLVTAVSKDVHEPYVNRNTGFKIVASKSSIEHFLSPSTSTTKEAAQKAREAGEEYENPRADIDRYRIISELPKIAENAILVEEHADSHGRAQAIYRMFYPMQLDDKIVVVKFTVQKTNGYFKLIDGTFTENKAYDVLLVKKIEDRKESYPQGQRISFPQSSGMPVSNEGAPQDLPNISIREMLQNVKDQNGNSYINADGTGNFSILTESGKIDFSGNTGLDYLTGDAVYNQEKLQQTAEQGRYDKAQVLSRLDNLSMKQLSSGKIEQELEKNLAHMSKKALYQWAKEKVGQLLGKEITDPLGNKIFFAPNRSENVDEYALHMLAGKGKPVSDIDVERAIALSLAEETIKNPLAIITSEARDVEGNILKGQAGNRQYIAIYEGNFFNASSVIVRVSHDGNGRVVTSFAATGSKRNKKAALRRLKKSLNTAIEIHYITAVLSGHPRSATRQSVSQGDASLHRSGTYNVSESSGNVNGEKVKSHQAYYQASEALTEAEQKLERDNEAWNGLIDFFKSANKAQWKNNKDGKLYHLMDTPLVLQLSNINAANLPLEVYGSFFKHSVRADHPGMTYSLLKDLPKLLADPVLIYKSNDKFIALLDKFDTNGAPMVASIELNKDNKKFIVNLVNSVYGKDEKISKGTFIPSFEKLFDAMRGNIVYINKKRSADWVGAIRNQYPMGVLLHQSASFDNNIHDETDLVKLKEQNKGYYQNNTAVTKGQISFSDNGQALIQLFKASDASTVIHETGHYFVEMFIRHAFGPQGTARQQKDAMALLNYAGITLDKWQKGTADEKRQAHERLAEAMETWVMEGKASDRSLKRVLQQFSKWLKKVYESITRSENAKGITPEVREVFDRMLSAEAEVERAARAETFFARLPDAVTSQLSERALEMLADKMLAARDKAVEILTRDSLKNYTSERRAAIDKFKKESKAKAQEEVSKEQVYAAALELKDAFGENSIPKVICQRYTDPNAKPQLTDEQRMRFELVATLNGYDSGDAMAKAILDAPPFHKAVEAKLQEMAKAAFGDYNTGAKEYREKAIEALYNNDMAAVIAMEQQIIEDMANDALEKERTKEAAANLVAMRRQQAKAAAKAQISTMTLKEALAAKKFAMAERRAAMGAQKALKEGRFAEAARLKQQQALCHALVRESLKLKQEVERSKKFIKRLRKMSRDKWGNEKHYNQYQMLMRRMGIGRRDFDPSIVTQSLQEYAAEMSGTFDFVDLPGIFFDNNVDISRPMELTFDEFTAVVNGLRNLRQIALSDIALRAAADAKNFADAKTDFINNLGNLETVVVPELGESSNPGLIKKYFSALRNADNFFAMLDGWKDNGYFYTNWYLPLKHAWDREGSMIMEYEEKEAAALKQWLSSYSSKSAPFEKVAYAELGDTNTPCRSASKIELIYMLINLGNEGNSKVLCSTPPEALRGCALWVEPSQGISADDAAEATRANLMAFLGKYLTVEDVKYAQAKIDHCEAYWTQLADLNRKTKGFAPKKVEARPVGLHLANGNDAILRGGYFPLIRDSEFGSKPMGQERVFADTESSFGAGVSLATNQGSSIERSKATYPLKLMADAEKVRINRTIHDICFREVMADYKRMVNDKEVYSLMVQKLHKDGVEALLEMLQKTADPYRSNGMDMAESTLGGVANWLKNKAVNAAIMLNLKTACQNVSNAVLFGQSIEGFTHADTMRALANAARMAITKGGYKDMMDLCSRSTFMRERMLYPDITLRELKNEGNMVDQKVREWGAALMVYTDNLTAAPVWVEAYRKQINSGATEEQAIDFADAIIRRTLGSSRVTDVASMQRGNAIFKLLTAFQSFFITQYNQWEREFNIGKNLIRDGQQKEAAIRISSFVATKYLMCSVINIAIASMFSAGGDDEDDEELKKDLMKDLLSYPLSMGGPVGSFATVLAQTTLGMENFGYRLSVVESLLAKILKTGSKINKAVTKGEGYDELIEAALTTLCAGVGVPYPVTGAIWNVWDILFNDMDPELGDIVRRRPVKER